MAWHCSGADLIAAPLQATAVGTGMGLGFCLVLAAPVLAPVLTLAHATDRGPGGGCFAGTVLPVLLLGIVTHPVIQRVMLVAAHLRPRSPCGSPDCGTTQALTGRPAVRRTAGRAGGRTAAGIDILLDLLGALALQGHHRFGLRLATRTSRTTRRDYDFTKPRIQLESDASSGAQPDLEDYDYPARFSDRERGKHLANRALERHRSDYRLAEGRSDQPSLVSGHFLSLTEHANPAWNDLWLLTEVLHEGKQPQVLEEVISSDVTDLKDDFHQGYRNRFCATPWDVPYRPPLEHPKPRVLGSQRAVVIGPEGEEIDVDGAGEPIVVVHGHTPVERPYRDRRRIAPGAARDAALHDDRPLR